MLQRLAADVECLLGFDVLKLSLLHLSNGAESNSEIMMNCGPLSVVRLQNFFGKLQLRLEILDSFGNLVEMHSNLAGVTRRGDPIQPVVAFLSSLQRDLASDGSLIVVLGLKQVTAFDVLQHVLLFFWTLPEQEVNLSYYWHCGPIHNERLIPPQPDRPHG